METTRTDLQLEALFEFVLRLEAEERQLDRILLGARNSEEADRRDSRR